jgi:hypothetical protein
MKICPEEGRAQDDFTGLYRLWQSRPVKKGWQANSSSLVTFFAVGIDFAAFEPQRLTVALHRSLSPVSANSEGPA